MTDTNRADLAGFLMTDKVIRTDKMWIFVTGMGGMAFSLLPLGFGGFLPCFSGFVYIWMGNLCISTYSRENFIMVLGLPKFL
jgi:hypothetical protein